MFQVTLKEAFEWTLGNKKTRVLGFTTEAYKIGRPFYEHAVEKSSAIASPRKDLGLMPGSAGAVISSNMSRGKNPTRPMGVHIMVRQPILCIIA